MGSETDITSSSMEIEVGENEEGNNQEEACVKQKIEEPRLHMSFDSIDEVYEYYRQYAMQTGFGVSKRSSKKVGGVVTYFTVVCHKYGEPRTRSKDKLNPHPVIKAGCRARLGAKRLENGKWGVTSLELSHNHPLNPSQSHYQRCNRRLTTPAKRRCDGINMNKSCNPIRVENGENQMPSLRKDHENSVGEAMKLRLIEGDINALQSYFTKAQVIDSNFFCAVDVDEDNRIRNLVWADARFRAACGEFGDVITVDTTYLTDKYDLPLVSFVGVNHHGQTILLGCGLISNQDTATFVWLFDSWLSCMSGRAPRAIITHQDNAMQNAIGIVFPDACHRWCLWHIMNKIPENLKGCEQYESIKSCLSDVVYDSLIADEFECEWNAMIHKYDLGSNEWLGELYTDRHRWVPCYVKDCLLAGMSTIQRSESMNAFFDGFVNPKTSLREFVDQYDKVLRSKVEKEIKADFHSFSSYIPCITPHAMEKQIQKIYTNSKFIEFQKEVVNVMFCECKFLESHGSIFHYEVRELHYGEDNQKCPKVINLKVCFIEEEGEGEFDVKCNCRLFEFRGILCKHIIKVLLFERSIYTIPTRYILRRWRKDIKRQHTKSKATYNNWKDTEQGRRYDRMCDVFHEVADMAYDTEERCNQLIERILDLKKEWNRSDGICENRQG